MSAQLPENSSKLLLRLAELEIELKEKEKQLAEVRREFQLHRIEVEETISFLVKKITGNSVFSVATSLQGRLEQLELDNQILKSRLERYTNLPFFKLFRRTRARILGLPVPEN